MLVDYWKIEKRRGSHLHAVMSAIVIDMVYKVTKVIVAHTE